MALLAFTQTLLVSAPAQLPRRAWRRRQCWLSAIAVSAQPPLRL